MCLESLFDCECRLCLSTHSYYVYLWIYFYELINNKLKSKELATSWASSLHSFILYLLLMFEIIPSKNLKMWKDYYLFLPTNPYFIYQPLENNHTVKLFFRNNYTVYFKTDYFILSNYTKPQYKIINTKLI